MAIQVRRGNEVDFDANKMLPGEWAVSLDTKYVRMCFAPGVCLRMATYEGFEEDMAKIETILKECQDIEEAVSKIQTEINAVAIEVEEFATSAEENALKSQSYAVGGTGTRENEDIDNSKYYYNQVKQASQSINGIIPMGTVSFAELPQLSVGDPAFMYNVSDAFVSDARFNDGGGIGYGAGNNVFWTAEGKWDVTASSCVSGVRGSAEDSFRTGNVTITPADLGLENVPNVTTNDQTPTYTLASENAALVSGEKLSVAFGKISKAISSLISHLANVSNPHGVTKAQIGLGNAENTADSDKSVKYAATAGSATKATQDASGNNIATTYLRAERVQGLSFISMSQAQYDALTTKNANTIYFTYDE